MEHLKTLWITFSLAPLSNAFHSVTLFLYLINMYESFFIETYGCQMNVADSELISGMLIKEGLKPSDDIENADIIFVNTCAIREHAEDKVHSRLGFYNKLKKDKPEIIIGVLGCMAQNLKDSILQNKTYVDIVLGPDSYRKIIDLIQNRKKEKLRSIDTNLSRYEVYSDILPSRNKGINAWIPIMRGCDKFCTFCIVPFTRGRERSRSLDSILNEAIDAVDNGYKEITLLGQNVNSYKFENIEFHDLLESIAKIKDLKRIRYTSPHPQDMSEEVINVMNDYENICNYVHLPLQSGSNRILERMNRTYSRERFIDLYFSIKEKLKNVGISTDIIVGFPGETDQDFQDTISLMEEVKFDSAFTFKYSSRPGTKAANYNDNIDEVEKQVRLQKVIDLQKIHSMYNNRKIIGNIESVLIEKESKKSELKWTGRTESNKWVAFDKKYSHVGDIVNVKINQTSGISLQGDIVTSQEMEIA